MRIKKKKMMLMIIIINYVNDNNNNKLNDNFNFSFDKKNFNNQSSTENEKKSKNNQYSLKEKESLNILNKYKKENENPKKIFNNLINNFIYTKKESIRHNIRKKKVKKEEINKSDTKYKNQERPIKKTPKKNNIKLSKKKKKEYIDNNLTYTQYLDNKLKIENFNILIQDKKVKKDKIISVLNDNSFKNKSAINGLYPHKFDGNIEIQNISNLSYSPLPNSSIEKEKFDRSQIMLYRTKNFGESVAEKVRKLIRKKAKKNKSKPSLSTKLNLNTDLTLSDSDQSETDLFKYNTNNFKTTYTNNNKIKRNIEISSKTIFCVYYKYDKISILAFDYENKIFSFHDFSDFSNFEENYKLSLNNNNGNIFLNCGKYLYIITGKNLDLLYIYVKNNHSNGNLISYEYNLICLSGDFNKSVEIYSIKKNNWDNMPEMIKERSCSGVCILNNKFIFNLFGYNSPTKKYLDDIEYFDMSNKINQEWKLIDCRNFSLKIKNFFCISHNNKIIIFGGFKYNNENEEEKIKFNNNFIKIIFPEENLDDINDIKIEELIGKTKDFNKNKEYSQLLNGGKKFEDKNEIIYEVFDNKYNCHIFKGINNTHDIFYADF